MVSRRAVVGGAVAIGVGAATTRLVPDAPLPDVSPEGLRRHAARRGMSFGCMVYAPQIGPNPALEAAIVREADTIVPGIELKWGYTEKHRGEPDYVGAEKVAGFAAAHGLRLRGHAGFWYRNIPGWSVPLLAGPGAEALILARIGAVVSHFRGRVFEWDVVNEAIEPKDGLPLAMRRAPFGRATDYGWVADCFHAAREADPAAKLFYNDYSLENRVQRDVDRRAAVLALLAELRRRNAPVDGLGLQTHISVGQNFSARAYRDFLGNVAAMGLSMRLTEFDVISPQMADVAERDRLVADQARRVLDVAFDQRRVEGLMCWGLSDGYAKPGVKIASTSPSGIPQRGLPLDADLRRKPLWTAIAAAFDAAPPR